MQVNEMFPLSEDETPGDRLAAALIHKGIRIKELSNILCISDNDISNWIFGRVEITRADALILEDATGISAEFILEGNLSDFPHRE